MKAEVDKSSVCVVSDFPCLQCSLPRVLNSPRVRDWRCTSQTTFLFLTSFNAQQQRRAARRRGARGPRAEGLQLPHRTSLRRAARQATRRSCAAQKVLWQRGQVLFWLELNHLYRQAAWNLWWHVRHSSLGSARVAWWMMV